MHSHQGAPGGPIPGPRPVRSPSGKGPALLGMAAAALTLTAAPAGAVPFDGQPKILLHLASVTTKNRCGRDLPGDCRNMVTNGGLYTPGQGGAYFAYVLGAREPLNGLTYLQFGISYESDRPEDILNQQGVDIFSWSLCGQMEFVTPTPAWPLPGGGNAIVWEDCQYVAETVVAGYFYLGAYSPDRIRLTPRPIDGQARVGDCCSNEYILKEASLGSAAFSEDRTEDGCNPCQQDCPGEISPRYQSRTCYPSGRPGIGEPAILIHVAAPDAGDACIRGRLNDPRLAVTAGEAGPGIHHFAYLLVNRGLLPSVGRVQCGIAYESNVPEDNANRAGLDILSWTLCASQESPTRLPVEWPKPGGGNVIQWSLPRCQIENVAVAGYFYVAAYSSDRLSLTTTDGYSRIYSCGSESILIRADHLGYASFSPDAVVEGCNPVVENCVEKTAVESVTWSSVKALYRGR